jgi:hypothetical protein
MSGKSKKAPLVAEPFFQTLFRGSRPKRLSGTQIGKSGPGFSLSAPFQNAVSIDVAVELTTPLWLPILQSSTPARIMLIGYMTPLCPQALNLDSAVFRTEAFKGHLTAYLEPSHGLSATSKLACDRYQLSPGSTCAITGLGRCRFDVGAPLGFVSL